MTEICSSDEIAKVIASKWRAYAIARRAHNGQMRKGIGSDKGKPYIVHPERVALAVRGYGYEAETVAILHDVVEDTSVTLEDLKKEGFTDAVISGVDAMTHRDGESYLSAILRAKADPLGCIVKRADIQDNLRDINKGSLCDKYNLALYILNAKIQGEDE